MAIARTGAILPNKNYIPTLYSTLMQAKYYADNVVPHISNHDYSGEISKVGDVVTIRKRPSVEVKSYTVNQELETQTSLLDETLTLSIDYADYFNVPISDVDRFQSDIEFQSIVLDEGAKALATTVETRVLQSIYSSATSTVTASALDSTNALKFLLQASLKLNQLNVPQDNRFVVIDPITAYFLNLSDLKAAYLTGEGSTPLRSGIAVEKPVAGFKVYISNNLSATGSISHIVAGHMDALCFASQISKVETIRNPKDFGDLLRSLISYGFKVTQPDALVHVNVTSFGSL